MPSTAITTFTNILHFPTVELIQNTPMGARRGGQEGALAPPWKFKNMGAPPRIT